ncbi:IS982 family transposase [Candidatus Poribacteria bacterium]|nr:IS982 family transposase [Candidatus Poribacteria bacterium]
MELQSTLKAYALQLKNVPRMLVAVAGVVQKMMKTLYDAHFPDAENRRPGRNPECPDSDILAIGWLLEYMTEDSENTGYPRLKAALETVFRSLPERSRFNRRRRNLSTASEVLRRALTGYLPKTDVFIVDSFPIPICDFKRAKASRSDLKWETDASGTLATYGHCATKSLGTFLGFRGHVITTGTRAPVDFAIASANIDDRDVLPLLSERGRYPVLLGDKGYISGSLQEALLETENTCLLPTLRSNQKHQYPKTFRKLQVRVRRRIETTIGQLTEQFGVSRVRARTQWGLQTRMSNKFGASLLGVFLNHCLGRSLMKLKDLVLA